MSLPKAIQTDLILPSQNELPVMRDTNINLPEFPFLPSQFTEIWEPEDTMTAEMCTLSFIQTMHRKFEMVLEINFPISQRTRRSLPSELEEDLAIEFACNFNFQIKRTFTDLNFVSFQKSAKI
ncbi:unnamed protein product [Blepharisma stoltei]|uniref:Uncharacterized protein n=1 Tax=Blepharisma stoltei TaxID=1481888 RepID=A0AAU9J7V3_9CILI|nr:unnamed protein product [Blepharisma stoltei]